jgi:hypothetical protein
MGWRSDQAYEDSQNADYAKWYQSLSLKAKAKHHSGQIIRFLVVGSWTPAKTVWLEGVWPVVFLLKGSRVRVLR